MAKKDGDDLIEALQASLAIQEDSGRVPRAGARAKGARRKTPAPMPADEHSTFVERQVERLREQLLDLSNRNRLLNFKHPQKSRKQVRVVDELPSVLYERLLSGKTFRFKAVDEPAGSRGIEQPVAEAARQQGLNPDFALGAKPKENIPDQHVDTFIQVLHYPTEMSRRLEGMRQEHLTSLQELGVPSLYAVFGFLEWYERANTETPLLSPLVLVPLEIERSRERGLYQHRVSATSDEPEPNRTLSFRLKQDIGLTLPDLEELIEKEDIDAYFTAVERAIANMPHWRVRRFVTVCAVSFARQVMYEDLAPERWQERGGRANNLLRSLLAGVDTASLTSPSHQSKEPVLVTEGDSTQIAAIKDALAGRSMVVKGPPGTGKSQTITNLIAAALAEKKTVLFVAEKMAALEVVKKRLDDAGLANFCLALHSTRAKKRDVLDALDKSLKAREVRETNRKGTEPRRQERLQAGEELEAYLNTIANPVGSLGLDARQLVWREQSLRSELGAIAPELLRLAIPNAMTLTTSSLQDAMRCLKELEAAIQSLRQPLGSSPWSFVTSWDPTQNSIEGLVACIEQWVYALRALVAPLVEVGWPAGQMRIDELMDLGAQLADLSHAEASAPAELVGMLLTDPEHSAKALRLAADLEARIVQARRVENVCPVDRALPHRSRLTSLMSVLAEAQLLSDGMTYSQIAPRLTRRRDWVETLRSATESLRSHATTLGLPSAWDGRAQRAILQCGKLAAEAGNELLRRRVAEALEQDSRPVLEEAAQVASKLRASRAELDGLLTGWDKVGSVELRRHATILRSTGFFGRVFGSTFKSSRTAYLSLSTGRTASRDEMAAVLQRAAEQVEAEEKTITGSARLQRVCGAAFEGLSTNFEQLIQVAVWGETVRCSFPGADILSRWARDTLFNASATELAEFGGFCAGPGQVLIREADASSVDLQQKAAAAMLALDRVEHAHAGVAQLEVDGRTLLSDLATVANALEQVATYDARIDASSTKGRLGTFWKGPETDPNVLRASVSAAETIRDIAFPSFASSWLVSGEFTARIRHAIALGRGILEASQTERYSREQARASGVTLAEVVSPATTVHGLESQLAAALQSGNEDLACHVRYVMARNACGSSASVDAFCRAIEDTPAPSVGLAMKFEWTVLRTLAAELMRKHPKLIQETWSGDRLAQLRDSVRTMEDEAVRHRRTKLAAELSAEDVAPGRRSGARREWTDAALITHEIGKSKRNIPIRALMSRAHDAILALTPCLMMSPLSIAQFLEEPGLQFDLLIVDEASQLRPEESLGALLRAKQVVVVGDEQQLPPTSFFKRTDEDALDEDDYEDVEAESLLDLAMNVFGQPRVLRWHYRSRHESLIAFSNSEFYRNELVVAPSPRSPGPGIGVSTDYVRGLYQASTNRPEAERTVQIAFELMKKHPKRSIGVVAINKQQADLIRDLVDQGVRDDEVKYIESWKNSLEPFFVKNLENVQGDEADIIVISMTYGPDATGRVYQRFGPIVGKYGHRRLNVLFSRAKHQLVLVTSMKAEDVRVDGAANRGAQVLKSYLEYAAHRATASRPVTEHQFERLVEEVTDLGFDVVPGVGTQSLELDLGVTHPDDRSGFVAAIEVDAGETKSLLKAADRELIRPLVLGRLGWSIVQAWTSDWLREPAVARRRMRDGLAEACRLAKRSMPAPRAKVVTKVVEDTAALPSGSLVSGPPAMHAELRTGEKSLGKFEIHGSRIRIGRGKQCEIRVPDEYEEVAAQHVELRWDRGHFAITEIDPRAGIYVDSSRLGPGALVRGQSHTIRLGLGVVLLRLAYGGALQEFTTEAHATTKTDSLSSSIAHVMGQLGTEERQFVTAISENGQIRTNELVALLGKSAVRVNGMVRQLRRRLHDAGVPSFFEDVRLPDGEVMYRRMDVGRG